MTLRTRLLVVLVLAFLGAALSGLLLLERHGAGQDAVGMICGEGATSGCAEVSRSAWAQVGGVSLAAVGLFFYLSLALLLTLAAFAETEVAELAAGLALALLAVALAVDLALLGVQALAIKAYCRLCLLTYLVNVGAVLVLAPFGRAAAAMTQTAARPAARRTLLAWGLASLAAAAAVSGWETALSYREAAGVATMLGSALGAVAAPTPDAPQPSNTPAAAPTAAPTPPGPAGAARLGEELRKAQDLVKRLQETLDDPDKLQEYMNAKAAREYAEAKVMDVELGGIPFKGPGNAPIRVVEYSDFLCPWCRNLAGAFANYLPQSGNRVALYFKNYPLDATCNKAISGTVHAGACWLALGGVCANDQGRFWQYHDKVYASQLTDPKREDAVRLAGEAGLNAQAFEACLASPRPQERVAADIGEGKRIGVSSTPTVLVNGKKLPRIGDFLMAVEKESQRLRLAPLPPPQAK